MHGDLEEFFHRRPNFCTRGDLQLQAQGGEHGQERSDLGVRVAGLDLRDSLLPQTCFFAQLSLTELLMFASTLDRAANLLGAPGQVNHP